MNRRVEYTATRELISGRTEGDEVSISFDNLLSRFDRSMGMQRKVNRSISNLNFITLEHVFYQWNLGTIPLANDATGALLFREFLSSVADQQFLFAPGSEYDGGASPSTTYGVILESSTETRVRIGPSADRFRFSFRLRQAA